MTSAEVSAMLHIARVTVLKYARRLNVAKHGESYIFGDEDVEAIREAMRHDGRKKENRRER